MRRWTGRSSAKMASKPSWPPGIWPMAPWCSMTCPARRSRATPARWERSGTPATGSRVGCRSSTGCCAHRPGCPVAIEVFDGNTADPKTLTAQIDKLKTRFELTNIALVGDRGMLTSARIRDELRPAHLDWISALRAPQIKTLVEDGALQLSLFDEQNLFEITHPDYPGERLVCCHNPALADERARKRAELLAATEKELQTIAAATRRARRPLRGTDKIAPAGGQGAQQVQDGQAL